MDYIITYIIGAILTFVLLSTIWYNSTPAPPILIAVLIWPICLIVAVGVIICEGSNRLSQNIYKAFHK